MIQTIPGSAFLFQRGSAILSQRAVVLAALMGLHVLLAVFLAKGMSLTTVNVLTRPIEGVILDQPLEQPPPPQVLDPQFVKPELVFGPLPDPTEPVPDSGGALTGVFTSADPVTPVTPVQPQPEPIRQIGKHRLPNTEDYYPADLRRRGIEGAANVRVCVDESGAVQGAPSVEKSSGNPRLDEGAVNVARDGHYARAMQGQAFVPNCYAFRVIFQMR